MIDAQYFKECYNMNIRKQNEVKTTGGCHAVQF
jgi:hypothetical protein